MISDLRRALQSCGLRVVEESVATVDGAHFAAIESNQGPRLAILAEAQHLAPFEGQATEHDGLRLLVGPRSPANLAALRQALGWLRPTTLGLHTSVGFGDRLGIATPGHVAALRAAGAGISPIFAQQSVREMGRTGRSPREVVDDATWGVFCTGWREPFGADADHLKTPEDVEACLPMGYTLWTLDPGDHVDTEAEHDPPDRLKQRLLDLPWSDLDDSAEGYMRRYQDRVFEVEGMRLRMDGASAARAAVKYGRAVAHTRRLVDLIRARLGSAGWELEVAVDETEHVTSHLEHFYMVLELQRLGVRLVSYAPRYLGEFEKGVDYRGDRAAFERHLGLHAAIARQLGPYKLSLHSGSDKFSIFEAAARQTRGLVHLKTAGTSYVEALRTLATLEPPLFRAIYAFARDQFAAARVGYHISGQVERAPAPEAVGDAELPALLDHVDARQVLHVTYGQVLQARDDTGRPRFRPQLLAALEAAPDTYAARLQAHFGRHLAPFAAELRDDR